MLIQTVDGSSGQDNPQNGEKEVGVALPAIKRIVQNASLGAWVGTCRWAVLEDAEGKMHLTSWRKTHFSHI